MAAIVTYCAENELDVDQAEIGFSGSAIVVPKNSRPNPQRDRAMKMFSDGATIAVVAAVTERAQSTVSGYLEQYIEAHKPSSVAPWVDERTYDTVSAAMDVVGMDALRPIFVHLDEQVPYETIRIVAAHLRVRCAAES
jgi:ATP-dependent DNA helicase RecQ